MPETLGIEYLLINVRVNGIEKTILLVDTAKYKSIIGQMDKEINVYLDEYAKFTKVIDGEF